MDRNFPRALQLVLKHEGGWADNPKDPGGATMKGITLSTYRRIVDQKATKDDLRHISDAQVAAIYRRQFWAEVDAPELPDGLDYAVFDFAVNSGPVRAAKYLQAALGMEQDGVVGPATLRAVAAHPAARLVNSLCDARLVFMRNIKGKDGKRLWATFGKGWTARVAEVRKEALIMCAAANVVPLPTAKPAERVEPVPAPVEVQKPVVAPEAVPVAPEGNAEVEHNLLWRVFLALLGWVFRRGK